MALMPGGMTETSCAKRGIYESRFFPKINSLYIIYFPVSTLSELLAGRVTRIMGWLSYFICL